MLRNDAHRDRRRDPRHGGRQARLASGADAGAPRCPHSRTAPQRIGLSATVKPIEEVARLLGPSDAASSTSATGARWIWRSRSRGTNWARSPHEMWAEIYDRVAELILAHRTTLVFVNTRRLSERVAHALAERLGENAVLPHHGSLSRSCGWKPRRG